MSNAEYQKRWRDRQSGRADPLPLCSECGQQKLITESSQARSTCSKCNLRATGAERVRRHRANKLKGESMYSSEGNALAPIELIKDEVSECGYLVTVVWDEMDVGGNRGIPSKAKTLQEAEALIKSNAAQGFAKSGLSFIEFKNKQTGKTYSFTVPQEEALDTPRSKETGILESTK